MPPTDKVNDVGIYQVQLYINGMFRSVVVDDYVPVDKDSGQPGFCRAKDQEVWAIILEKAWAKLHGNYIKSTRGVPSFASFHLTGVPAENFSHDKFEPAELW